MIKYLYTFTIYLYKFSIGVISFFHKKAKLKIEGIQNSKTTLDEFERKKLDEVVFMHCSSQGEHEQAKPIIRWILANTNYYILITFFSPSGYINSNSEKSDRITKAYLPFDTPTEMSKLISKIKPNLAIIIKNEWWWNLLLELQKLNIPTYLVSATFRKEHYFIKYINAFTTSALRALSKIFVVDDKSKDAISNVTKSNVIVAGDTRIDQVNYLKSINQPLFARDDLKFKQIIVYGSVWESDIDCINELIRMHPDALHLIYPHELNQNNINRLQVRLTASKLINHTKEIVSGVNIITSMGELKFAYKLATMAYIGGGFGEGLHNILEASVYNIPTVFGPNYKKSNEAKHLVSKKCAFTVTGPTEIKNISLLLDKEIIRKEIESKLKAYFSPELSPTEIICREIF